MAELQIDGPNRPPAPPMGPPAAGTLPTWRASISASFAMNSSQEEIVQFDVGDGDTAVFSTPFPEEVEVAAAGWYMANAWVRWDGNTTGQRELHIVKNGFPLHGLVIEAPQSGRDHHMTTSRGPEQLAAGDNLGVLLWQTSGVPAPGLDVFECELCIVRVA